MKESENTSFSMLNEPTEYKAYNDGYEQGIKDEKNRLHEQIESLEKEKLNSVHCGGNKTDALGYCRAIADVRALLAEGISE